jgi:Uma2 family endonuclease
VRIVYEVEEPRTRWLLDEEDAPESTLHDQVLDLLKFTLLAWIARERRTALVARNLACCWDPSDTRVGVDPDLVLVEPAPPGAGNLAQLRIWAPGHTPPRVGVEIVSASSTAKDYREAPARYCLLGASELWVFDPECEGPSDTGGPFVLQVWRRHGHEMRRVYAGAGPAPTEELDAWLVVTDAGTRLRLAQDAAGTRLWLTDVEEYAQRADAADCEIEALRRALAERGSR